MQAHSAFGGWTGPGVRQLHPAREARRQAEACAAAFRHRRV